MPPCCCPKDPSPFWLSSLSPHSPSPPPHMFGTLGSCRSSINARISGRLPGVGKRNKVQFICIYTETNWHGAQEITDFLLPRCTLFLSKASKIRTTSPPAHGNTAPRSHLAPGCRRSREDALGHGEAAQSPTPQYRVLLPRHFRERNWGERCLHTTLVNNRPPPRGNSISSRL